MSAMTNRDRNMATGKLRRVWALIIKESRQIIRDPSSIAIGVVMPVMLILGQLALWYQSRPLQVGEEAVITMKLTGNALSSWPNVCLQPTDAAEITNGPFRLLGKREICWDIKAGRSGYHRVVFQVDEQTADKELAIGDGFMRVSMERPGWSWSDALLHPWEQPFSPDSPIRFHSAGAPVSMHQCGVRRDEHD